MSVESISEGSGFRGVQGTRMEKKEKVGKGVSPDVSKTASKDRIELSKNARMMNVQDEFIREAVRTLTNLPEEDDVRRDVLERVTQRLESGYYDQDEVMDEVIRSMQAALL